MKKEALKLVGINAHDYSFGGLKDASFCLYEGETVALSGLFNSGRITLVRILSGDHPTYAGDVYVQGRHVTLDGYSTICSSGIVLFGETRRLFVNLSLYENVYISQIGRRLFAPIRHNHNSPDARRLQELLEIDFSQKHLHQLNDFEKFKLEILKSYVGGARIFLFVNLTMYLSEQEAHKLADIIRLLNQLGVTAMVEYDDYFPIFEEVVQRCIVVRDGVVTTTIYKDENDIFNEDHLRHAIVGRAFDRRYHTPEKESSHAEATVLFRARALDGTLRIEGKAGDIIGLYDPRETLPKTVDGLIKSASKDFQIWIGETLFEPKKIFDLVRHSVAVITKEISDQPIFLNLSPVENVGIFAQKLFGKPLVYHRNTGEYLYNLATQKHLILRHCAGLQKEKHCFNLSYEQQYELMIAKWLAFNPKIMILFTPLSNVDTKNAEHYKDWHMALRREGKVQILISSSYDSLEEVCTEIISLW